MTPSIQIMYNFHICTTWMAS